ncbi:MAG: hypothetical protein BECKG1743D_GA0114223_109692 [Candidatus Kentron sp. G]|nr:MAG: hypothetical protein BECKG1743F_GA0114225_106742 [Candidatus Kentron sp. G]VFN06065.1 MAG: hypothetical protein BECKG1743E_GA0114224_109602 [Candidatus Kentron sp. G]VFN07048.1 MAG: hypothetical protein BECKG1743D_GA0114223_109692 [Candidatus Kentron sp. G]
MSAIRHPCLIVGRCPSNFEGRNSRPTGRNCKTRPLIRSNFLINVSDPQAGLLSSLGESAKFRAQMEGFPEKAPYAGLETGAPREN